MKRTNFLRILAVLIISLISVSLKASDGKVKLAYDVDFETRFDNREFYKSAFSKSMTIFGARLNPSIGVYVPQNDKSLEHHLMIGADVMKDFGSSEGTLIRDFTIYYRMNKTLQDAGLELYAGIFPRRASEGHYSEAFFSDSLKFYDNNLEGILLKLRRPSGYWEVGCDWMGQFGEVTKERFMIFSSGVRNITSFFDVGFSGYMYHFAGSQKARGVVDNILLNPYLKFDFARNAGFQELSVRVGWLQAMQHDRVFVGHYVFPGGGEVDLGIMKWNVGIQNRLYCGAGLMPYYNNDDASGDKYGSRLYQGDPFYRMHDDGTSGISTYDRFDVFYEPHVGKYLSVRIAARFHFHGARYSGCQQIVALRFNMNNIFSM